LLQQGLPVADAAYYYGDHVPNFAQMRQADPAHVGAGYDYDVVTAEVLLNRMEVKDERLVLPEGVSYRLLVLPELTVISLPVLRKLQKLVAAGATVVGPRPSQASGQTGFPESDTEVKSIADDLWGKAPSAGQVSSLSPRQVLAGQSAREVLLSKGIQPDVEWECGPDSKPDISYIHRRDGETELYFVANRATNIAELNCTFRVAGKAPELWDAVSGEHRFAAAYSQRDGRTTLPLELGPCGSQFVVFRESAARHPASLRRNEPEYRTLMEIAGPWSVSFDPKWGGPELAQFDSLVSWTTRDEPGIKYYSGTAAYRKSFELPATAKGRSTWLDLGEVRELAEVRVNGQSCGITWAPPFRVDISRALHPGSNQLEIEVVNFWPNRIIGDQLLPETQRLTRTNIRKLTAATRLTPSGLLGPVRLEMAETGTGISPEK